MTRIVITSSAKFQPDHCTPEVLEKLEKIRKLSDAIAVQERRLRKEQTYHNALVLQQLKKQREELWALIPKIQLAWVNPNLA